MYRLIYVASKRWIIALIPVLLFALANASGEAVAASPQASCAHTSLKLTTGNTFSEGGYSYIVYPFGPVGTLPDNGSNLSQSTVRVFENSTELGPAHSVHAAINTLGQGRFSHWSATDGSSEALRISATDSTNPRTNGRTYSYCATGSGTPLDTTPPAVSLASPASGATVSGSGVTVSANAADNTGVAGIQFKLDGASLGAEYTTAPYTMAWNSTTVGNGPHTLSAVARDASGNSTASVPVSVTVNNVAASTGTKTLLYGWINDSWLSDTISRWGGSGFGGFIIPGIVQWFTPVSELETHRSHFTNLNQRGAQYGITDNFFCLSLSAQSFFDGSYLPAWQDDAGWNTALSVNFTGIASFARTTGMKGIVFDTENYTSYFLWNVADPRNGGLSRSALKALVYKRGQQLMQTLQAAYPGIQVILIQEGAFWASQSDSNYEMWPDFYNGMASSQPQPGIIVGSESTYPEDELLPTLRANPDAFIRNYASMLQSSMVATAENPSYWQQQGSLAIGMRPLGASYSDKSARYSPDVFAAQLNAAKISSRKYVWVYSHGSAWWQMSPAEVDRYSNNPWHYTADPADQVLSPDPNLGSYFNVVNGSH